MVTTQPVCVTGASGFVAAHIVRELLERGYTVRGTVRSPENPAKYSYLTELPGAAERLTLVGGNLNEPSSYDEAVAGCEYVIHTASPYFINVEDAQRDLVDPAVRGTTSVLESCVKASVKRVVLTSSIAAIVDEPESAKTYSEADWNEKSSLDRNPYYFSKAEAERTAWAIAEQADTPFDLIVINPSLVIGESLGPSLNASNAVFVELAKGTYPAIMDLMWAIVDVKDVATAHVNGMEHPEAEGRYLCAAETRPMASLVATMKGNGYAYKTPSLNLTGPIGTTIMKLISYTQPSGIGTFLRTHLGRALKIDNSKIKKDLGIEFRSVEETILETLPDLIKWGHLKERG